MVDETSEGPTPVRRLRITQVFVQPVVVWDDGDDLEPGPQIDAVAVPPAKLAEFIANLNEQVAALAEQLGNSE